MLSGKAKILGLRNVRFDPTSKAECSKFKKRFEALSNQNDFLKLVKRKVPDRYRFHYEQKLLVIFSSIRISHD